MVFFHLNIYVYVPELTEKFLKIIWCSIRKRIRMVTWMAHAFTARDRSCTCIHSPNYAAYAPLHQPISRFERRGPQRVVSVGPSTSRPRAYQLMEAGLWSDIHKMKDMILNSAVSRLNASSIISDTLLNLKHWKEIILFTTNVSKDTVVKKIW